jgi:hypothetical protein
MYNYETLRHRVIAHPCIEISLANIQQCAYSGQHGADAVLLKNTDQNSIHSESTNLDALTPQALDVSSASCTGLLSRLLSQDPAATLQALRDLQNKLDFAPEQAPSAPHAPNTGDDLKQLATWTSAGSFTHSAASSPVDLTHHRFAMGIEIPSWPEILPSLAADTADDPCTQVDKIWAVSHAPELATGSFGSCHTDANDPVHENAFPCAASVVEPGHSHLWPRIQVDELNHSGMGRTNSYAKLELPHHDEDSLAQDLSLNDTEPPSGVKAFRADLGVGSLKATAQHKPHQWSTSHGMFFPGQVISHSNVFEAVDESDGGRPGSPALCFGSVKCKPSPHFLANTDSSWQAASENPLNTKSKALATALRG